MLVASGTPRLLTVYSILKMTSLAARCCPGTGTIFAFIVFLLIDCFDPPKAFVSLAFANVFLVLMLAFTAAALLMPNGSLDQPLLLVDRGRIVAVDPQSARSCPPGVSPVDLGSNIIAPAYFDLHIHGSAGYDVMDAPEGLPVVERFLARHGVASYLPTTVTAPIDRTLRALERLAEAIETREQVPHADSRGRNASQTSARENVTIAGRAQPLGIHLEGPFISHARRGVHPSEHLLPPRIETFERFWQAARGRIRMMTIAPELEGALELITLAAARGVCISLGHSDADFSTAERAASAGARHATHVFNAMRRLGHRHPGVAGAVLTDSRLTADLIADGIHLDPAVVKLIALAKGPDRTVLVTDAISATGMRDGLYPLGSIEVEVKNGRCESGGELAGSVLTMDRAVRNLAGFAEWSLPLAVAAASRNPGLVLSGNDSGNNKGVLTAGADANFIVLDQQGNVLRTFIGGVDCSA
jgi:N-acetylglucosamine-6-phosphate deacetylase